MVRITGVARVRHRPDLRIDRLPELVLAPVDADPLMLVGSHLLPQVGAAWIEWLYTRPTTLPLAFTAELQEIVLTYRSGGRTDAERVGPIRFEFRIGDRPRHPGGGDGNDE